MPAGYWITALTTAAAVMLCVALHYEGLRVIGRHLPRMIRNHRALIVLVILGLLSLHVLEIWIFGGAYWLLLSFDGFGMLDGDGPLSLPDCIYYSATVFTTLGFGDIVPRGPIRFMTGTEAIAGLTLITWSASYTFLFMQKTWDLFHD